MSHERPRARHQDRESHLESPSDLRAAALAVTLLAGACTAPRKDADLPSGMSGQAAPSTLATDPQSVASADPVKEPPVKAEDAPRAAKPEEDRVPIHGSLSSRYRYRTGEDANDQDMYETLVLDVGDARRHPVTAHFIGRLSADLDGQADADSKDVFPSLSDTFDDPLHGWVYEAYVDLERPPALSEVRIGRQIDFLTPEFAHFDGVRLATRATTKGQASGGLYAGVPVRLYEATSADDSMYGAWGEARPWRGGRVRLDWMHVDDDSRLGPHSNDLWAVSAWQRAGERLGFDGSYSRLEQDDRDLRLRGTWDDAEADLTVQATWYQLLETQFDLADEFDPFSSSLKSYFPFAQVRLQASKGLSKRTRVEGGLDLRRVDDSDDEGPFNHDYDRGWASLVLLDALLPGLVISLTGDVWDADDADVTSWGLDLTRKLDRGIEASAGTSYALYDYDLFSDSEHDNVRVWYLRMRKKIESSWTFDLGYDFEDADQGEFHSFLAGATWHF
jgi:hypothetical protein